MAGSIQYFKSRSHFKYRSILFLQKGLIQCKIENNDM